jgi:hypothetical protein
MQGFLGDGVDLDRIEGLFAKARPPRAGSTEWYDACDLLGTELKRRLRERFGRGFAVEVYGDEVGVILRVRGDGYGARPWSVDRPLDPHAPLDPQVEAALSEVEGYVRERYL